MNKLKARIARWLLGVHVESELADIRDESREQFNHHERMLNSDLERIQALEQAKDDHSSRFDKLDAGQSQLYKSDKDFDGALQIGIEGLHARINEQEAANLRSRVAALEVGYAADFQQIRLNLEHIALIKTPRKAKAKQ
jgi:hypothetical protein